MNVGFQMEKNDWIRSGVFFAAALLMYCFTRYPLPLLFLCPLAYMLIRGIQVSLNGKLKLFAWVWTIAYFLVGPWFSTQCIQHIILEPELFRKTKKSIFKLNILCVLCIYLAVLVIVAEARWAWRIAHMLCVVVAFVDYFVYEFRENEISFADISSVGTGISVLKAYRLVLHDRGAIAILLTVVAFALVAKWKIPTKRLVRILIRVAAVIALAFTVRYLQGKTAKMATQTWEKKGSYKNGFVLNFILGIGDGMMIDPPEGYSEETIQALERAYAVPDEEAGTNGENGVEMADGNTTDVNTTDSNTTDGKKTAEQAEQADSAQTGSLARGRKSGGSVGGALKEGVKPTIITIMNESYADFRKLGELATNQEVMPFMDSLQENTLRGFALSSVFGAKTPNSEWEYMTGNTMAFLPDGSVVYEQFLGPEPTSMVSTLKNEGYRAVAMHPYNKTGWKRNTVYPRLGFDEMYFLEDGYFDETKLLRKYVTDAELFEKIIKRYEEQKGQEDPLFIMAITMQNHGGYKQEYDNMDTDVIYEARSGYFTDANQFLSLEHQTDIALEELIGYFSTVDEPVEIIFFGDHLPSLQTAFFRSLNGKGISGLTLSQLEDLFSVPFFIWTNYDTEEGTLERTSLNYLGTLALERAGIKLPAYNRFLKDMMQVIPAMNARAFYSNKERKYLHYDKATGEDATWLDQYRALQYNEMFDTEGRSSLFFPYLSEDDGTPET